MFAACSAGDGSGFVELEVVEGAAGSVVGVEVDAAVEVGGDDACAESVACDVHGGWCGCGLVVVVGVGAAGVEWVEVLGVGGVLYGVLVLGFGEFCFVAFEHEEAVLLGSCDDGGYGGGEVCGDEVEDVGWGLYVVCVNGGSGGVGDADVAGSGDGFVAGDGACVELPVGEFRSVELEAVVGELVLSVEAVECGGAEGECPFVGAEDDADGGVDFAEGELVLG